MDLNHSIFLVENFEELKETKVKKEDKAKEENNIFVMYNGI